MKAAVALLLLALSAGCAAPPAGPDATARPSDPAQRVTAVNLMAMPSAVNLDDAPGPDGVRLQVYLFHAEGPGVWTVRMEAGTLDVLLYQGRVTGAEIAETPAFHVWSFSPFDLQRYEAETSAGPAYQMSLSWGRNAPRSRTVTLVARYRPAAGAPVYSEPTLLSVGP